MSAGTENWARARLALALLAVDPRGLGGAAIRARVGPVRQAAARLLAPLPGPALRIHPEIDDAQLFGGLDLGATLAAGAPRHFAGVLARAGTLILPTAERIGTGLAARLAQACDGGAAPCLVLLDEGAEPDETAPAALADRLAFHLDLEGIGRLEARGPHPEAERIEAAQARLAGIDPPTRALPALVAAAAGLGIASLRAPLLALRAARAHAALQDAAAVGEDDLRCAVELVLASRATRLPEHETANDFAPPPEPPAQEPGEADTAAETGGIPAEMLIEAVRAILPSDVLERLAEARTRPGTGGGAGAGVPRKGNRRGRPLPPRPGRPDVRARIDLLATLRAAAPWQPLRRRDGAAGPGLAISPGDLRLKRFEETSDRLVVFCVDASGSAALARLAEAKGAVELMLARAYARRDQVALVAFRGQGAEVLLAPTRALVQAKRRLAALPGGGGTPLASGLRAGLMLAESARRHGLAPLLALLTDGRANVTLDGRGGRSVAETEALGLAALIRARGLPAVVIDTGARPRPALAELALRMGARHLTLPRADAETIGAALADAPGA